MLYKHLVAKIDDCHAQVDRITLVALEASNSKNEEGRNSDFMECFLDDGLENICKVLDWNNDKDTLESIEAHIDDNGLAYLMFSHGKGGYLAEIGTPNCNNFSYKDEKPTSWQVITNIQSMNWLYADTLDELSDKIVAVGEENFKRFIEEDKARKEEENRIE